MKILKGTVIDNLVDLSLQLLGEVSIKITESSTEKCHGLGLYETEFPQELLERE